MTVEIIYKGVILQVSGDYTPTYISNDRDLPDDSATFEISDIYLVGIGEVLEIYESLDKISDIEQTVLEKLR